MHQDVFLVRWEQKRILKPNVFESANLSPAPCESSMLHSLYNAKTQAEGLGRPKVVCILRGGCPSPAKVNPAHVNCSGDGDNRFRNLMLFWGR